MNYAKNRAFVDYIRSLSRACLTKTIHESVLEGCVGFGNFCSLRLSGGRGHRGDCKVNRFQHWEALKKNSERTPPSKPSPSGSPNPTNWSYPNEPGRTGGVYPTKRPVVCILQVTLYTPPRGTQETTMPAKDSKIWVRIGDEGDYRSFQGIPEAAKALRSAGVKGIHGKYPGRPLMGVYAPGYEGNNYISIYKGGRQCDDVHGGITDAEYRNLVKLVG